LNSTLAIIRSGSIAECLRVLDAALKSVEHRWNVSDTDDTAREMNRLSDCCRPFCRIRAVLHESGAAFGAFNSFSRPDCGVFGKICSCRAEI
jgi:hypothetical protein